MSNLAPKTQGCTDLPCAPAPTPTPEPPSHRLTPVKAVKSWGRECLYRLCETLDRISDTIQDRILGSTLEVRRARTSLDVPVSQMDEDLLAMYIRWHGHQVEKAVRYPRQPHSTRGYGAATAVRTALEEWHRRGFARRAFIEWAEDNLVDFTRWVETSQPQLHSEKELPAFHPQSPVWEVLRNRVSTRFWQPVPVEDEKIRAVVEAGTYAPTSCNRQTWKLYVRKNPALDANSLLSGVSNMDLRTKAPVAIYITIDNRLYPEIWAPAEDAGIMGLQLSLAATSLGLAGCLMYGAENFDQASFRREYQVPEHRIMYLMFLFGYPAERTLTTKRAHVDDIIVYI